MPVNCLIIDDEPLARKLIVSHVSKIDGLTIAAECGSAVEGVSILQKRKIDLIFLDIQMPEINGLQFIKTLRNPPAIILTTAHREFALDAFELDVMDYLLKPISFERLLRAVNKFYELRMVPDVIPAKPADGAKFIYLKSDRKTLKVLLDEILYIESLDDYVQIHLPDRVIVTRENISNLERSLPKDRFVRVHRSFVVSTSRIDIITSEFVEINKKQIPFGRVFKQAALKFLGV